MRRAASWIVWASGASLLVAPAAEAAGCRRDAVQVGDVCVDRWEASAWETTHQKTIKKLQNGKITDASQLAGVATQRGASGDDYGPACPDDASGCTSLYAASIPAVMPSVLVTWFQAAAACRNAGKRLASNQEWQLAAFGTPDTGAADDGATTCNTNSALAAVPTGSRPACVSDVGAYDMVGNLSEWVADWMPDRVQLLNDCAGWGPFSDDIMCATGSPALFGPTGLIRGGENGDGPLAGPFAVSAAWPWDSVVVGFRCARGL